MMRWNSRRLASLTLGLSLVSLSFADPTSTAPPRALRENTPSTFALTGARIVVAPGQTIDKGTIVFRDGVIVAVGPDVQPPADSRLIDLGGKTIYPGLIDAFSEPSTASGIRGEAPRRAGADAAATTPPATPTRDGGAAHWNPEVLADARVDDTYKPDLETNKRLRSQGIVARLAVPTRGIIKGISAVVDTSDQSAGDAIVNPVGPQHLALTPPRRGFRRDAAPDEERYPTSPMGAFTLVRQTLYDAQWYKQATASGAAGPAVERNAALEALVQHVDAKRVFVIDANDELYDLRAGRIADEFKIPVIIRGSGQEYRRLDLIAAMKLPVIVPVNFPKPPNVSAPEYAAGVSLTDLMDWDLAPENPARLDNAGVTIALSTQGLRDKGEYLKAVRKAVARGLPRNKALAAMTTTPATLLGVGESLGSLQPGKTASFVVTDGDLFDEKTKVVQTWVEGERFDIQPRTQIDPRGQWRFSAGDVGAGVSFSMAVTGEPGKLRGELSRERRSTGSPETAKPPASEPGDPASTDGRERPQRGPGRAERGVKNFSAGDTRMSFNLDGDSVGRTGVLQFSGVFNDTGDRWTGVLVNPDGSSAAVAGERKGPATARTDDDPSTRPTTQPAPASFAVNYPLGDFGREAAPEQPALVIFANATIWPADGRKPFVGSVKVEAGRITAVTEGEMPGIAGNATVINLAGKHVSPGIIDCHSHMATDGGVNEGGQNITAEVRIGDFVDPDDINIYRQLAAGITSANVLHGSANAIGGQNQVIKLRWGVGPEQLKFEGAPAGIKFALGENPRQANGDEPPEGQGRYPQTRMGVEQLIRNAFHAAQDYRAAQRKFAADPKNNPPVRKDLELEAIAEILEKSRLIHCHSYRQDEILAFIRTCDDFGVTIGSLQHILEGYKVADAIAKHGATASSFSDWWAYKAEVWDAIPYNGAIMASQGIIVSFNSDDAEMARRLNSEAAKATKYGGVPPEQAIAFVTLNPARQLRIDKRVGSIEVGKDADLAVWSAPPMSMYAICEQTWVDGRKFFDRAEDVKLRTRDGDMRQKLIQKILSSGESMAGDDETPVRERNLWPRYDEHCGHAHDD